MAAVSIHIRTSDPDELAHNSFQIIFAYIGIRADVSTGNMTHYDLLTVLPFESRLAVVELTGRDILETLENSVRRYVYHFVHKNF